MGIRKGITLIVGGGYHGKSTLLEALELGVYNHIAGDGREYVITDDSALKIRAEDGRRDVYKRQAGIHIICQGFKQSLLNILQIVFIGTGYDLMLLEEFISSFVVHIRAEQLRGFSHVLPEAALLFCLETGLM